MTKVKSTYLALVAVLLSPMAANAVLINGTSLSGNTVVDTVNNQEWLDLSVTDNLLSPDAHPFDINQLALL